MQRSPLVLAGICMLALLCTALPTAATPADYPFLRTLSDPGGSEWSFFEPFGIAIKSSSGYVHVTDKFNIRQFTSSGTLLHEADPHLQMQGIALNSTGYLFIASNMAFDGMIHILDPACTFRENWFFERVPYGVAINSTDHIFVTFDYSNEVRVLRGDGTVVGIVDVGERAGAIAVDGNDRVIVAERSSGIIHIFDRNLQPALPPVIVTGLAKIEGLATDAEGNIYATDYYGSAFRVFSPDGTWIGESSGLPMIHASGIAVNTTSGEVYVVDKAINRVFIFGMPLPPPTPTPTPTPVGPSGSFAAYPESGTAPLTVQFLDYTQNGRTWAWDFGDGGSSDQQYPVHVYNQSGLYTVSVTVTDWSGQTATTTKDHLIRATPPPSPAPTPVADFSANATSGPAPMTVAFTDASSPAPSHRWWQFGDGASSTDANPVHTYTAQGTYTVNLTVWTSLGQATVSKPAYITVGPDARAPVANFSIGMTSTKVPCVVRLTDTSTGNPTSWRWEFSSGVFSTAQNLIVRVNMPGRCTYVVTLTAWNAYGASSMTKTFTTTGSAMRPAKGDAISIIG
jgi:PKD repeat protein